MIYSNINCPFEGSYGQMYFQICPKSGKIFLICAECERIFNSPNDLEIEYPVDNLLGTRNFVETIPELGCSIDETRVATQKEVVNYGWGKYIKV